MTNKKRGLRRVHVVKSLILLTSVTAFVSPFPRLYLVVRSSRSLPEYYIHTYGVVIIVSAIEQNYAAESSF